MPMRPDLLISGPIHEGSYNDCDCACPDGGFVVLSTPERTASTRWQAIPWLHRAPLPDRHELWFDPFGQSNVIVANEDASDLLDFFANPRPLSDLADLSPQETLPVAEQLIGLGLLQPPDAAPPPLLGQTRTLTAWLHVTNACNLRCTYCYLNKTNEAMDEATGRTALNAIFRAATRHGYQAIKLKYAGGEATLNFALIQQLHAYAEALASENGLALSETILSNGVAVPDAALRFIRDAGIKLSISLDGGQASHDAQRPKLGGQGSYRHVLRTIERAVVMGVRPALSITITAQNADTVTEAIDVALQHKLRFNLNFYRNHECGGSTSNLRAEEEQLIAGLRAALSHIEACKPDYRLIDGLLDRSAFNQPHDHACGAGHSYMVIDHQGNVARCQMEIEQPVSTVFEADPLLAIRNEASGFQPLPVAQKRGCSSCTWQRWCAGGCPLLTYRVTGRNDVQSPYCNVYRATYPTLLRLEGMRLLRVEAL